MMHHPAELSLLILLTDLGVAELNLLILLHDLGVGNTDDKDTLATDPSTTLPCFSLLVAFVA